MRRNCLLWSLFIFLPAIHSFAQTSDSTQHGVLPKFQLSGYADAYYAYYTDSVGTGNYQKFPSVSPRSHQFGLNTAQVSLQYDAEKARGIVTLHFGDIARSAWSPTLNAVMEAHAGIRLFKKLWLDAGLFRTHFGTEGLLPKENLLSSVSVNTFYEPYYEAGARLNYNPNEKLSLSVYVLNGYNLIEDNNKKKSFGLLLTYALGDKGNLGYSNYIGDDSPEGDSVSHWRIHQNLFFNYQLKKLKAQVGFDYCIQTHSDIVYKSISAKMFSGIIGLKYQLKEKFAIAGRVEIFQDPQGFMSAVILDRENNYTGFKVWGITLGAEFKPTENTYLRVEGRQLQMNKNQEIFSGNGKNSSDRMELSCNIGISF